MVMTTEEKDIFIKNASVKILDKNEDFREYLVNGWKKAEPYDDEERELFQDKEIWSIMFYPKHMISTVLYFALLVSF